MADTQNPEASEAVVADPGPGVDPHAEVMSQRGMFLVGGVLMMLVGIFAIAAPVAMTFTLTIFLGAALTAAGVAHAVHALGAKCFGSGMLRLGIALLYLIAGLYLIFNLPRGAATIGLLIGILFMIEGIGRIVQGLQLKPHPGWGWCAMGGVVSAVLGVIIWQGWPYTAMWIPGLLIGINLLFYGVTLLGVWTALGRVAPAEAAGG